MASDAAKFLRHIKPHRDFRGSWPDLPATPLAQTIRLIAGRRTSQPAIQKQSQDVTVPVTANLTR